MAADAWLLMLVGGWWENESCQSSVCTKGAPKGQDHVAGHYKALMVVRGACLCLLLAGLSRRQTKAHRRSLRRRGAEWAIEGERQGRGSERCGEMCAATVSRVVVSAAFVMPFFVI